MRKTQILSVINTSALLFSIWPSKETARGIHVPSSQCEAYMSKWEVLLFYSFHSSPILLDTLTQLSLSVVRECKIKKLPPYGRSHETSLLLHSHEELLDSPFNRLQSAFYGSTYNNKSRMGSIKLLSCHTRSYRVEPKTPLWYRFNGLQISTKLPKIQMVTHGFKHQS